MPSVPPTIAPSAEEGYFRTLFNAAPFPVMIVDDDVRILDFNPAAIGLVGLYRRHQIMKRGGEVFHCVHADEAPGGCGHSEHCKDCVIRNSVQEAFRDGKTIRRNARMSLRNGEDGAAKEIYLSISATPFAYDGRPLILLVLEDLTEMVNLREIIPICCNCKKIRTDPGYWESVEEYFRKHSDLKFSHGICDYCMKELYGDIDWRRAEGYSGGDSPSRRNLK